MNFRQIPRILKDPGPLSVQMADFAFRVRFFLTKHTSGGIIIHNKRRVPRRRSEEMTNRAALYTVRFYYYSAPVSRQSGSAQ